MSSFVAVLKRAQVVGISAPSFRRASGFLCGNVFVWLALLGYRYISYYQTYLSDWTQRTLLYLAIGYSLYALYFYSRAPLIRLKATHSYNTFMAIRKLISGLLRFLCFGPSDYTHPLAELSISEKRSLLFGIVKLFFIPLMLNFLNSNFNDFSYNVTAHFSGSNLFTMEWFNQMFYPLVFSFLFLLDTAVFCFGYLFESASLSNKVRSVEPTALGWFVAIICYPPFNSLANNYTNWYSTDNPVFHHPALTIAIRIVMLLLAIIYVAASVALGPKASNLTNRGIVSYGPYRWVRHPAYISKNLLWWLGLLPFLSIQAVLSMGFWSIIYFMRAVTEERHLSADGDYVSYCQKVKFRFIPGVI